MQLDGRFNPEENAPNGDRQDTTMKIPTWLAVSGGIVALILALGFLGSLFREFTTGFICLWLGALGLALIVDKTNVFDSMTVSALEGARRAAIFVTVAVSILIFAHFDLLRDRLGARFMSGYSVSYVEDVDDYGRRHRDAEPTADGPGSGFALWVFEWATILACIGVPFQTWRSLTHAIDRLERSQRV